MVKIKLKNNFPEIVGLKNEERPIHLLEDSEKTLYLITDINIFSHRMLIGKENDEMSPVESVRVKTYRDGGTTEIEFLKDNKKGEIYVPSSFKEGLSSKLRFEGEEKELKKVGYDSPYLFSVWKR